MILIIQAYVVHHKIEENGDLFLLGLKQKLP